MPVDEVIDGPWQDPVDELQERLQVGLIGQPEPDVLVTAVGLESGFPVSEEGQSHALREGAPVRTVRRWDPCERPVLHLAEHLAVVRREQRRQAGGRARRIEHGLAGEAQLDREPEAGRSDSFQRA